MPGMSPRIKAKKGRFGAGGLVHTVEITGPASGSSFRLASGSPANATVPFTATAKVTDDLGAVTEADVVWSSAGTGFSAANGSPTAVTFTGAGTFTLTATVTHGGEVVTDSISVTVTA